MITANEARELTTQFLEVPKELSIWDRIQLRQIERRIHKAVKNERFSISMSVCSQRPLVLKKLREEGEFKAYYWRARYSNGLRLIVSWDRPDEPVEEE